MGTAAIRSCQVPSRSRLDSPRLSSSFRLLPWYRQADGQVESLACLVLEVSSVSGETTYFQLHTECQSTCRSFISILPSLPSLLPTILLIKASDPGRYWYLNTCTTGFGKKETMAR